ncbi:unnamed protein product [Cyprideis torosa]|uniref:Uncharacterized protein n=1 Tax=Cyprideis torosa TaxID=163714 RepID=A0A7R8ZXG3_9CRUS|nr:unnamed protein product [Cyprideis torosa]CAG0906756.1 unnamed protein product [Cyprideis torosa]
MDTDNSNNMQKELRILPALATLLLAILAFPAQAIVSLDSISHTKLPGDHLRVELRFSDTAPQPVSFSIANPARIALDFPHTRNGLSERTYSVNVGATRSIISAQANDRTRLVVNLTNMVHYEMRPEGYSLFLDIAPSMTAPTHNGASPTSAIPITEKETPALPPIAATEPIPEPVTTIATPTPVAATTISAPVTQASSTGPSVNNIDFRRGKDGSGRILIHLSDPNSPIDIKQQGSTIIADLIGISVPAHLQRRLDVTDFATPVLSIDTRQSGRNSQVIIKAEGDVSQLAYQSERVYTIEVKPYEPDQRRERQKREITYSGEKLSLNFQDIEVRSVLQLIADFTGLNVVVSDSVSGNLTLRLKNVPWDQALDIIMRTKGLAKRQEGNVLLIAPADEIAQRERAALESSKEKLELSPLRTEIISLNYADAQEMADLLRSQATSQGDSGNSILSSRGSVTIDRRTNNLLVHETTDKIDEIRALIQSLDIPVRQVMIESRIVTASDNFTREIGANLGISDTNSAGLTTGFTSNFDLPSKSGILTLSRLSGMQLDLELSAAQAEDRAEIVASPRIITSNKTKARIEQGVEIPYEEATSSGATSVAFKKAVMSLEVTPHITKDERINMELLVTRDTRGEEVAGVPTIDTRKVQTQVLVDNGETIVLGGIFEKTTTEGTTKVPLLGDIPVLGQLFRVDKQTNKKTELLIFVTPKIINENLNLHELTQRDRIVLATGGGAILREENRKALSERGFVVYLKVSVRVQLMRTSKDKNRPLLQTPNPAKTLTDMAKLRAPLYEETARFAINTDHIRTKALKARIIKAFQRACSPRKQQRSNS